VPVEFTADDFFFASGRKDYHVWTSLGKGKQSNRLMVFAFGESNSSEIPAIVMELGTTGEIFGIMEQCLLPATDGGYEVLHARFFVPCPADPMEEVFGQKIADHILHDVIHYGEEVIADKWPKHFR
jgi:hypothetical protein